MSVVLSVEQQKAIFVPTLNQTTVILEGYGDLGYDELPYGDVLGQVLLLNTLWAPVAMQ